MEVDQEEFMVLRGDQDIANEVKAINYEAITAQLSSTRQGPGFKPSLPSQLQVLSLALKMTPSPSRELDRLSERLGDLPLSLPIAFNYSKENTKTPHTLAISTVAPSRPAVLLEIASLDPTCRLAQTWVTMHTPAPLTKAGNRFKHNNSKAARMAKERKIPIAVPVVGGGGLLDALIVLETNAESGVGLRGVLKLEGEEFTLELTVYLEPTQFFPLPFSRAKQLLLNRLFPHDPNDSNAPQSATIDFFYGSLRRAPLTSEGLPLDVAALQPPETKEERERRLRRELKGKGRAIDHVPEAQHELEEDVLLRPRGLEVEMLPFQSRSVRWMLAREGKWAKVLRGDELAQTLEEEREEVQREEKEKEKKRQKRKAEAEVEKQRQRVREGKKAALRGESESEAEGGESEAEIGDDQQRVLLEDLSEAALRKLKRGPLWERVVLFSSDSGKQTEVRVWLNRVTGQISQADPLDADASQHRPREVKDEEEMDLDEDEEEAGEREGNEKAKRSQDGSMEVVGGIEGHGLLADEVGSGKTVTTVALILLHPNLARRELPSYYDTRTDANVQPTGLTLVVCPAAISGQWAQELSRLAPKLRVLRYEGIKALKPAFTPADLADNYDLILTTFDVLRKEVTIARKPHKRTLRNQAKREIRYRRSLFVEIDFLRIVADETQMVGDAFGPTSETLSLIPRQYSWAVTSTPLRDKIEDIRPLLTYLRVEPIANSKASLTRLLEECASFNRLFGEIGERTLKSQVQNELFLPRQTRLTVPLEFAPIERFYFDTRYSEMLRDLGLEPTGAPREQIDRRTGTPLLWQPDKAEMNKWLGILRALAAHPQVGSAGRQALGNVLKTVDEVYKTMREQAISGIQTDQKAILALKVQKGQYSMWDRDVEDRFGSALRLFEEVLEEVEPVIADVTSEIHASYKESRKSRSSPSGSDVPSDVAGALQVGFANDEGQQYKEHLSDREKAFARSLGGLRNRLRELLLVKHSALFFSGHAYFNLKQEEQETELYARAERLRQTLLQDYEDHVEKAQTTLISAIESRDTELEVTDLELPFNEQGHGIVALSVYEDIEITSDILNGYAELIFTYRQTLLKLLLKTVSIAGENATGNEYEERAITQETLEVYIEAYTVLVGEWCYGILGSHSALAEQYKAEQTADFFVEENLIAQTPDVPPHLANRRKRDAKSARLDSDDEENEEADEKQDESEEEDAPAKRKKKKDYGPKTRTQKKRNANIKFNSIHDFRPPTLETGFTAAQVLRYELLAERIDAMGEDREFSEIIPLRHLMKKLKDASELSSRDAEVALLAREKGRIAKALGPLEKTADRLRSELASFTTAFNARVLYFKNLQNISDSVKDPDLDGPKWRGLLLELEDIRLHEQDLVAQLDERKKRKRYLDNLDAPDGEDENTCPICAEHYNDGVLLACVHLICRSCFKNWYARSHTCPLCKARIEDRSWQSVKYRRKAQGKKGAQEVSGDDASQAANDSNNKGAAELEAFESATPALAELPQAEIDEINSIETVAALSTKSDAVVKHVKLLRRRDPEAKIVIFSAWQDALQLLMEAFDRNGLVFVRLEGSTAKGRREGVVKRFAEDPDVAAFFLHTRSQSAGLTLTCARYMILLEPLLAPQLEIQATARIWRIGQTKRTTVFQYYVRDCPDERVAQLRARANTSLFLAESNLDARQESALGQQQRLASKEARSQTKNEASVEALDDEDEIARCLLAPEHYLALQQALLVLNNPLPPLPGIAAAPIEQEHNDERVAPEIAGAGRFALANDE